MGALVQWQSAKRSQVLDFHRDFACACERNLTEHVLFLILYVLSGGFYPDEGDRSAVEWVGREISSVPEHCKTEWDRRAAGMGRQPRKAE